MSNSAIRETITNKGLYQYQVAKALGIAETTFCRWLRRELDPVKKDRVLRVIQGLTKEGKRVSAM